MLYGLAGSCAQVVMTNSTWTCNHIRRLWRLNAPGAIFVVFPPCDTASLRALPLVLTLVLLLLPLEHLLQPLHVALSVEVGAAIGGAAVSMSFSMNVWRWKTELAEIFKKIIGIAKVDRERPRSTSSEGRIRGRLRSADLPEIDPSCGARL